MDPATGFNDAGSIESSPGRHRCCMNAPAEPQKRPPTAEISKETMMANIVCRLLSEPCQIVGFEMGNVFLNITPQHYCAMFDQMFPYT